MLLSPDFYPQAASLLAEAFHTNPPHVYIFPDVAKRAKQMAWLMPRNVVAQARSCRGFCRVDDGRLQVMGFWQAPGASDYVTSVTSAQSVFDYQQTDEMVMGNALSDTTVCFSPALVGGGYDVFAAKTSNFPLLATNGSTGPAAEGMFVTVQLVNSFMFYGEEQTGFILNSSGTILFDLDSDNKSSNYIWPWFVDGEKAIIGSGWELESFPSPYTYREEDNKMVVSIVGTSANSDSGVMDMQMILDLATNEIILNYGRFGTGGIGAGIFAGTNFNDDGASVIVEYIPGTGVIYDPE